MLDYESRFCSTASGDNRRRVLFLLAAILNVAWFSGLAVGWWLYLDDEMAWETTKLLMAATLYSLGNVILIVSLYVDHRKARNATDRMQTGREE